MCCAVEIARGTCAVVTVLNIILGVWYVAHIRPRMNEAALASRATTHDTLLRSRHQNILDVMHHETGGLEVSQDMAASYAAQHGYDVRWETCDEHKCIWWSLQQHRDQASHASQLPDAIVPFSGFQLQLNNSSIHFNPSVQQLLIPPNQMLHFTLNGTVPVQYSRQQHRNDVVPQNRTQVTYAKRELAKILASVYRLIESPDGQIHTRTAKMQRALSMTIQSLSHSHIAGRDVLVFGSLKTPILEVLMLAVGGARRVVSVDPQRFIISDKRIITLSPSTFAACLKAAGRCPDGSRIPSHYSVILSYRNVQHVGLGRNDHLNPFADVQRVQWLRSLLPNNDPEALLILGVPLGNDCLKFNRYRVYGRRRLPLILLGFSVVQVAGFDMLVSDNPHSKGLTFGQSWALDDRCLGHSQRVPTLVLSPNAATPFRDEPLNGTWNFGVFPYSVVVTWFRIPGLAGPFPPHRGAE